MLSYALAIAVAISSLVLFSTAFLMSKIHRRDDFLWSGVGLFYALILWYCAKNITGAVLLGQAAATALLVSYSWQTIKLRQMVANPAKTAANSFSVVNTAKGLWKRKKPTKEVPATPEAKAPMPTVTEEEIAIPDTPAEIPTKTLDSADASVPSDNNLVSDSTASESAKNEPVKDKVEDSAKTAQAVAKATTPDASSIQFVDRPTSPAVEAPSVAPLPNKLPESADSVTKPTAEFALEEIDLPPSKTVDNIPTDPVVSVDTEAKTDGMASETAIADQATDNIADSEVTPVPEIAAPEIAKPASPLDSLETVEVAEVLEAEADSNSSFSESNQANIIEVATTDIDADTETQK